MSGDNLNVQQEGNIKLEIMHIKYYAIKILNLILLKFWINLFYISNIICSVWFSHNWKSSTTALYMLNV